MTKVSLPTLSISVLLLAACGGDAVEHDPVPLEDYPAAIARTSCASWTECCTEEERAAIFPDGVTTEEECVAHWTAEFARGFAPLQEAVEAGRMQYDDDLAGDCFGALESRSCNDLRMIQVGATAPAGCDRLFRGAVAVGGECSSSSECESTVCDFDGTTGTCREVPSIGEACTDRCGLDAICFEGTCTARRENGEACGSASECRSFLCEDAICVANVVSICTAAAPGGT